MNTDSDIAAHDYLAEGDEGAVRYGLPASMRSLSWDAPAELAGIGTKGLLVGAVGIVGLAVGFFLDSDQFFRSYLVSFVYWLSIALGCLAISMVHHLSRGAWGLVIRRVLEAGARTIPFFFLLGLPLLLGLDVLYPWSRPDVVAADELLQAKAGYLNDFGFILRYVIYFAVWTALAWVLSRISLKQDETANPYLARKMQLIAAPGLPLYFLAATFASFDWLMSLDPHWYSTIYGVWFAAGHGLGGLALVILMALFLLRREPMRQVLAARHFHDWGKLLLAFVMLWAYFAFSQFLIIWSANIPSETSFYVERTEHGWQWVALALIVGHFALPFLLLLSRDLKRKAPRLAGVAILILVMRWVDIYWQAAPLFGRETILPHWLDLAGMLAIGGLWVWLFTRQFASRSILPINAPNLEEAIGDE